jgi:hypothetical protein
VPCSTHTNVIQNDATMVRLGTPSRSCRSCKQKKKNPPKPVLGSNVATPQLLPSPGRTVPDDPSMPACCRAVTVLLRRLYACLTDSVSIYIESVRCQYFVRSFVRAVAAVATVAVCLSLPFRAAATVEPFNRSLSHLSSGPYAAGDCPTRKAPRSPGRAAEEMWRSAMLWKRTSFIFSGKSAGKKRVSQQHEHGKKSCAVVGG